MLHETIGTKLGQNFKDPVMFGYTRLYCVESEISLTL